MGKCPCVLKVHLECIYIVTFQDFSLNFQENLHILLFCSAVNGSICTLETIHLGKGVNFSFECFVLLKSTGFSQNYGSRKSYWF